MLLKEYLVKQNKDWDRDDGLKVEVVNRLRRLGYALVDTIKDEDKVVVAEIMKKASKTWKEGRRPADTLHVAYPTAQPVMMAQSRCPNCKGIMRSAIVYDEVSSDYCPMCRIVKTHD